MLLNIGSERVPQHDWKYKFKTSIKINESTKLTTLLKNFFRKCHWFQNVSRGSSNNVVDNRVHWCKKKGRDPSIDTNSHCLPRPTKARQVKSWTSSKIEWWCLSLQRNVLLILSAHIGGSEDLIRALTTPLSKSDEIIRNWCHSRLRFGPMPVHWQV